MKAPGPPCVVKSPYSAAALFADDDCLLDIAVVDRVSVEVSVAAECGLECFYMSLVKLEPKARSS